MKPVVVFGNGLFAEMLHFYFNNDSDYKVAGFTADAAYVKEPRFCGLPVVPFEEVEAWSAGLFPRESDPRAGAVARALGLNVVGEAVEGAALSLESVDNIERSDSLSFGVLGVCDRIANHALEE